MPLTITHSTPADGTFSATGAAAWDATHTLSVTGTSGQLQYNNAGDLAGMSGTSWNDTTRSLTLTGATVTASAPVLDLSQTWNNAAVTFTGLKANFTDTASAAGSLLLDLQVGGASRAQFTKSGNLLLNLAGSNGIISLVGSGTALRGIEYFGNGFGIRNGDTAWAVGFASVPSSGGAGVLVRSGDRFAFSSSSTDVYGVAADTIITRRAAANLRLGAADAAAPVAQTLSVQSVVAGTTNTAGANLTITGSQGTGTGAGGSIIFQVAPAGSSGTAQNALSTALTINSNRTLSATAGTQAQITLNAGGTSGFTIIDDAFAAIVTQGQYSLYVSRGFPGSIRTRADGSFGWGSLNADSAADLILFRDAANTLALRNGTNAQTFNLYGTYTDASNYERIRIVTGGSYELICEAAGTGAARGLQLKAGTGNNLAFGGNGGVQWRVNFSGHLEAITDNTYDIGASGANRPRNVFVANNVTAGNFVSFSGFTRSGRFIINATATDGQITLLNSAGSSFDRLQFGGTTTSFPAIKRSSAALQARLADDSAFTNIQGKLTTETNYTAGAIVPDGYLVLYDATGTAYKVPCVAL